MPHLICYLFQERETKELIKTDVLEMNRRCKQNEWLAYYIIFTRPYRNLFYCRIGKYWGAFLSCFLPPYKDFYIACKNIGGSAFVLNHPYSTIINARSIGSHFTVCQLTTIGNKEHGRNDLIPSIGNNVSVGANVTIIGNISIGDNVVIGAGTVIVKDIPSNCTVVGNPARIIRHEN